MNLANMKRSETTEQIGLINWARANEEYVPELRLLHHIPNEGIDLKSINYENGETEPFGPCAISPEAPFVYWGNDCCYLMAGRRTSDGETEAEFWKYLEGTEIV